MADGGIERVGMALSCRGLSVVSGCMHNLADWHNDSDSVAEISISRRRKNREIVNVRKVAENAHNKHPAVTAASKESGDNLVVIYLARALVLTCTCPIRSLGTLSRSPLPAPMPVAVVEVEGTFGHAEN
jgi:hypothetical protein